MATISPVANTAPKSSCDAGIKVVAIIATIVAIAGVALALVASQYVMLAGFAFLGISSIVLGVWGAVNNAQLAKLKKQLDGDATQIAQSTQALAATTRELGRQTADFQRTVEGLREQVLRLRQENAHLQNLQKEWVKEKTRLDKENQTLTQTKDALQAEMEKLNRSFAGMKEQVQQFLNLNVKIGQYVGAFGQQGTELAAKEQALQKAIASINTEVAVDADRLGQLIELGKNTAAQITQFVFERQREEHKMAEGLKTMLQSLDKAQELLDQRQKTFEAEKAQMAAMTASLEQLRSDLAEADKTLARRKEELSAQSAAIEQRTRALNAEAAHITQLQEAAGKHIAQLDIRVQQRRDQLQSLNTQILQKTQQLTALRRPVLPLPAATK